MFGGRGVIVHGLTVWGSFNQLSSEVMENKLAAGVCASTVKRFNKGRDNMWTSPWGERTLPFVSHNSFVGGGGGPDV